MEFISKIDIDFGDSHGGILHYKGYRTTLDEFLSMGGYTSKYSQARIGPNEELLTDSYYATPNNVELDKRIKTFMRDNEITVCETTIYEQIPKTPIDFCSYIVNYSFDNYKTFGFIEIRSLALKEITVDTYYKRADIFFHAGNYDRAIADLSKAIEIDPNNASFYYCRGAAYYNKGDYVYPGSPA